MGLNQWPIFLAEARRRYLARRLKLLAFSASLVSLDSHISCGLGLMFSGELAKT